MIAATEDLQTATDSQVLDLAARQRMLNQRFAREVLEQALGIGSRYQPTLALLRDVATAMTSGGELAVAPEELRAVRPSSNADTTAAFQDELDLLSEMDGIAVQLVSATGRDDRGCLNTELISRLAQCCERFHEAANRATLLIGNDLTRSQREAQRREQEALEKLKEVLELAIGQTRRVCDSSEQIKLVSANAEQTSRLTGEVSRTYEQILEMVQSVAGATEELNTSIREISQQANAASSSASAGVEAARESKASVTNLQASGQEIDQVVRLISSVAQQTNLLALNATIEAARAGEAGRGFSVVAQEVKALAASTKNATEQITAQVEAIQNGTRRAIEVMVQIDTIIGALHQATSGIAASVEEQRAASGEISRSLHVVASGAAGMKQNLSQVAGAATETSNASARSLTAFEGLIEVADQLRDCIDNAMP